MKIIDLEVLKGFAPRVAQSEVCTKLGYDGTPADFYFNQLSTIPERELVFWDIIHKGPPSPAVYLELLGSKVNEIANGFVDRLASRHPDLLPKIKSITTINSQAHLIPTPAERLARRGLFAPDVDLLHINGPNCSSPFSAIRNILDREAAAPGADDYHLIISVELPSITLHQKNKDANDLSLIISDIVVCDGAFMMLLGPDHAATDRPMPRVTRMSSYNDASAATQLDSWFEGPLVQYRLELQFSATLPGLLRAAMDKALAEFGLEQLDIAEFVFHPGARQVVDIFAEHLGIPGERLARCYEVFSNGGNRMSTLLWYALDRYLEDGVLTDGRGPSLVVGLGPGVDVETLLIE